MRKELERKSKYLSKILRHDPASAGIELDEKGWAQCNKIRDVLKVNSAELKEIVETNEKKRFEFSGDNRKIRARQGHSIDVDVDLEDVTESMSGHVLYHGTKKTHLDSILKEGLKKMSRTHVHLTRDPELAKRRAGKDGVILTIHPTGLRVWKSRNEVYLIEAVPRENINSVSFVKMVKFEIGDSVSKNALTWIPNEFDSWGRGVGIGKVVEVIEEDLVDIRWPGGRCYENTSQIIKECSKN